jgi:sulfate permease, SulP family
MKVFSPRIAESLKHYSHQDFYKDLLAGIIVGIVALPLAIAFGIASGVTPEKGLITAIIAGFLISLFGGSRVQIGGPTGAFIVIVYGIVEQYGVVGLAVATIIAGVMLVAMGIMKLGTVIKFVPFPVVVGFTSGIALTIFTTQIKDLAGMHIHKMPADFLHKWLVYTQNISAISWWSLGVGVLSIAIIQLSPRISKKIPGSLIAIILVTVLVYVLRNYFGIAGIETIGDRFTINASLPKVQTPLINFEAVRTLMPAAFTIALLGAIESLLSATVADGVISDRHDSNTELIAQGIANIVAPIFGGIPATGAIARTMTNINNGGRTPVAGIVHAIVLLLIMLFLGNLTQHIPMACLAGILIVVSYNMSEWRTFRSLLKTPKSDVAVLLSTFLLTVIFDLTIAIEVGMLLAVLLFLRRIADTTSISVFHDEVDEPEFVEGNIETEHLSVPHGVDVYEIEGPFFFGIANKFEEVMKQVAEKPSVRIIRMRKVPFIDSTGVHNLEILIKSSQKEGVQVMLSGVNQKVLNVLEKSKIIDSIGRQNIHTCINDALASAEEIVKLKKGELRVSKG